MPNKTAEEVLRTISSDLKIKGVSHAEAAKALGISSRQTVSNILSSKKYLSRKHATLFNEAFGYNIAFMVAGIGELTSSPSEPEEGRDAAAKKSTRNRNQLSAQALRTLFSQPPKSDMVIILSWFREAFSRRCDDLGLQLWNEVFRFSTAEEYINTKVDIGPEPMTPEEYEGALIQHQAKIAKKIETILKKMTKQK